jgi:Transposase DDE domain
MWLISILWTLFVEKNELLEVCHSKSGKQTYSLDRFYNGSASRTQKGLEVSVIAVVDVAQQRAYSLSEQQTPATPAHLKQKRKGKLKAQTTVSQAQIQAIQQTLEQLPPAPQDPHPPSVESEEMTRMDHYLNPLKNARAHLPPQLKYFAVDGAYSKQKFVDGVVNLGLEIVGKLRNDANIRYLYTGEQKHRGAKRKYDGKVKLNDLSRFEHVEQIAPELNLYTAIVWHVSLKRKIRLACLVDTCKPGKTGYALLFSTDVALDAKLILSYYKSRFQIEFIFRDAKQFTGLCDAQTRDAKCLDFHFNASLTGLNLAKYEEQCCHQPVDDSPQESVPFSMSSYKRMAFNDHLLELFISKLALDPTVIKSHPNYENLRRHGIIAA